MNFEKFFRPVIYNICQRLLFKNTLDKVRFRNASITTCKRKDFKIWYSAGDTGGPGAYPPHTHTLCVAKKKGRQREKRKGLKAETIKRLSPRSKLNCFNHFRASKIQKIFRVPCPLHFEIHFVALVIWDIFNLLNQTF